MEIKEQDRAFIEQDILGYLRQHENKSLLRFLTCGSVDDGKSTLIGRLLYDSKMVYEDQLSAIEKSSVHKGTVAGQVMLLKFSFSSSIGSKLMFFNLFIDASACL